MSRVYGERCSVCRRGHLVDCVDNHGEQYRGCAMCRIMTMAEIQELIDRAPAAKSKEGM